MGRQVRFFNYPADVTAFEEFLMEKNDAVIIGRTAARPTAETVPTLNQAPDDPGRTALLIVRPGDLAHLRWRHVPTRALWAVDTLSSPVIEYTPGYTRDGQPKFVASPRGHGRMWYQTSRRENDQLVPPAPDFVAWAGRAFRWIKKNWALIDSNYYSPDAANLWAAMWQIVLDEPWEGAGGDQVSRWRRQHDPDNVLPPDHVHVAVSRATRDRARRLTISVRTS